MNFEYHKPSYPLDIFVEYFFCFEGLTASHAAERFIPDGNVELLIDLRDGPQYVFDNETLAPIQTCRHVWTSGLRTKPITIPSGDDSSMMVVGFQKGMAHPFFPFPMNEISDSVVDSDLIWDREFLILREQLLATNDSSKRFALVEHHLLSMIQGIDEPNSCIGFALEALTNNPLDRSLSELSEKIGYSQKHFISMFRKSVGVTPKKFQRIMRFREVISLLDDPRNPEWTEIALKCGYFDQAHFINDFRTFSGFTPSEYLTRKTTDPNYIPVS